MPIRHIDEIFVPADRIRKTITQESLEELIASIQEVGLLHPPVVEANGALLAGERRFRALSLMAERGITYHCNGKWLTKGLIMTTDIRDLTASQRLQAELEENTIRIDISWQEKSEAVSSLHRLRELQKAEQTLPGLTPPPQTAAATAAEIRGKAAEDVTRHEVRDVQADLAVQAWLQSHPEDSDVANAKTRADALKAIEIKLEDEHRAALARRFLARRSDVGHTIQLGDLRTLLPNTPEGIYDVICADPPWGAGANQWDNGGSTRRHSYLDDLATSDTIYECIAVEGYRITKPKAHIYLFCAFQHFEKISKLLRSVGWDVWPRPLIWYRGPQSGIAPRPEHGPKNTYECIIYAIKGDKRVLQLLPDVLIHPKSNDPRAAAKPPGIYYDLLRRSCLPGDEVLDPCCGSAPILLAANALKLRATCYDIAEDAIGLASQAATASYTHSDWTIQTNAEKRGGARAGILKTGS